MTADTIDRWIYAGQVLWTPGRGEPPTNRHPFTIMEVTDTRLIFDFLSGPINVRFDEIEYAIAETRKAGGRVRIGAAARWADPGTFQRFLQDAKSNQLRTASYVVPVLVECGIIEYTMEGSAKGVRLIDGCTWPYEPPSNS